MFLINHWIDLKKILLFFTYFLKEQAEINDDINDVFCRLSYPTATPVEALNCLIFQFILKRTNKVKKLNELFAK